jgi:hypothetical protein
MGRESDIFGIVCAFGDETEKPYYLTAFEVLEVKEEVRSIQDLRDGKIEQIELPYVTILFRPRMWLPKLKLDAEVTFYADTWARPGHSFNELFPIPGREYCGFPDDKTAASGRRPQMDGTLYATLADARVACGGAYQGVFIAELWPTVLSSEEED